MPRRPRPTTRKPPAGSIPHEPTVINPKPSKSKAQPVSPPDISDESSEDEGNSSGSEDKEEDLVEVSDDEHIDVDAPRVAQWVDDDEIDGADGMESSESEESVDEEEEDLGEGPSRINLKTLQNDLSSLPLGTLRKAQSALSRAKALGESDGSENDESGNSEPEEEVSRPSLKGKEKAKEKQEIAKRKHKHAPMEVTSKRPVSRKKPSFEDQKLIPRDPRFVNMTGEFDIHRFQNQYGFLSGLHSEELKTLRDNLKRARKLLINSPRDLREEREQEVDRLERAVKRAESTVNKDRQEKISQEALARVAKEERERQKQGKGAWHLKDSEKKELLTRAKFDALAKSGGNRAVKKAIEKKQKKVAQKEKKKRPFAPSFRAGGGQGERPPKRQRFG